MAPPVRLTLALPLATLALYRDVFASLGTAFLPGGGQRVARRNAWAGMSADSARARARREADRALDVAHARAHARARAGAPAPLRQVAGGR